ncbi:thialysine N-epsilon-acetyltransferase-like isoform X1 [Branchiostoma lanceolatum]|uniref:thialysine N-epsilon-acetyltransferase-like isoform X1 n=1 Tax=Branchiostoma lanceolatum TaxID=7740 RepID=UPI003452C094
MAPTGKDFTSIIRPARPDDCGEIARMIKDLAEHQGSGAGSSETVTAEALREDAFRDDPYFRALVAEVPSTADGSGGEAQLIGYAMYYFCYSPFVRRAVYLQSFYVKPPYRGRGIGSSLMKEVAKIGVENSCNKMKWTCQGWDDVAIKFYKKCGGKDITEGLNCHLFNMDREELTEFAKS